MSGYTTAMSRYFEFSGRSPRSEFWFYILFYLIIYFVAAIIDAFLFDTAFGRGFPIVTIIVGLVHLIPSLSVSVRRLHDIDRTGLWLLFFILGPLVVSIIAFVIMGGSILAMAGGGDAAMGAAMAGMGLGFLIMGLADLVILIVALVFYCTAGTPGPNRYGPAPA